MDADLVLEAESFDSQITERVRNGHIPDLRYTKKCEYFYNNVWRHPDFVKLHFGEIFANINDAIKRYVEKPVPQILEVGCGPGFISLELARNGYDVTGIDLSPQCIKIAAEFSEKDPNKQGRGQLNYVVGDFFSSRQLNRKFDAIVFLGSLHHFPDQVQTLQRANDLLDLRGVVIADEPTQDRAEKRNAAIYQFTKTLLSLANGYYESISNYSSTQEIEEDVRLAFHTMKYEEPSGEKLQSFNDNSAGYKEMYPLLQSIFEQLDYQERHAFYHEVIGGLRFSDEMNKQIASTIKLFDKYLCETGVIQSTEFFFVGRKK